MNKIFLAFTAAVLLAAAGLPLSAEKITRSQCIRQCNDNLDSCEANVRAQKLDPGKLDKAMKACKKENKGCKKSCVKKY